MDFTTNILLSIIVFLGIVLLLVALLLWVRNKLMPKGEVKITINDDKVLTIPTGNTLIATLAEQKVYLPSACGGKGSCGQCKCRVVEGGGTILPTEVGFFTRKQIQDHWRLGCQVKVKENLKIVVPQSILNVKEYECTVVSNRNVATFIKEFKVQLPAGEHMDFVPGSYAQIKIPKFDIKYADFDKELIGEEYLPSWEKFKMFDLRCVNTEPTIRAYSMANYPAEGDVFMLTVRIATPPFKPDRSGFMNVNPGIASSYIFSLKPGDKVIMSGPYGEFHVKGHETAGLRDAGRETQDNSQLSTPRNDLGRRWRWYGSAPRTNHAPDTYLECKRPRDALFLWRSCLERGILSARLPATRERLPQLPFPLGFGPSRPSCRCTGREIYRRFCA